MNEINKDLDFNKGLVNNWIEIFKAGGSLGKDVTCSRGVVRNGIDIIDKALSVFKVGDLIKLCIGHPPNNSPVFGTFNKLKRVVNKDGVVSLYAYCNKALKSILEVIKGGGLSYRSCAFDGKGKLVHVGLLDGSLPAIKGLEKVKFNNIDDNVIAFFSKADDNFSTDKDIYISFILGLEDKFNDCEVSPYGLSGFLAGAFYLYNNELNKVVTAVNQLNDVLLAVRDDTIANRGEEVAEKIFGRYFRVMNNKIDTLYLPESLTANNFQGNMLISLFKVLDASTCDCSNCVEIRLKIYNLSNNKNLITKNIDLQIDNSKLLTNNKKEFNKEDMMDGLDKSKVVDNKELDNNKELEFSKQLLEEKKIAKAYKEEANKMRVEIVKSRLFSWVNSDCLSKSIAGFIQPGDKVDEGVKNFKVGELDLTGFATGLSTEERNFLFGFLDNLFNSNKNKLDVITKTLVESKNKKLSDRSVIDGTFNKSNKNDEILPNGEGSQDMVSKIKQHAIANKITFAEATESFDNLYFNNQ